jgi:Flp pilus assembly protein TadD
MSLQPSFAVYNQLGYIRYERGRWADAAAMYRKAAELAPDSYRALSNLGAVSSLACDFTTSLEAFRQALRLKPDDPHASSNLGLALLWTDRAAEAVSPLEKASRTAPDDFEIWSVFGEVLAQTGQAARSSDGYAHAITLSREAIRLNPRNAMAHAVLGASLARTANFEDGAREIEAALAIDGEDAAVLADAAVVAALRGRKAEALAWLRKAVAAGYCPQIFARQPEFASFRDTPEFQSIVAAPRKADGS